MECYWGKRVFSKGRNLSEKPEVLDPYPGPFVCIYIYVCISIQIHLRVCVHESRSRRGVVGLSCSNPAAALGGDKKEVCALLKNHLIKFLNQWDSF